MGSVDLRRRARIKRKKRVRKKIQGTSDRPRLSVFRSAQHIYAQVIDDTQGNTIASVSSMEKVVKDHPKFENKIQKAVFLGKLIGERALEKGFTKIVFDKNGYIYHGRVKAVSEGARQAGLIF